MVCLSSQERDELAHTTLSLYSLSYLSSILTHQKHTVTWVALGHQLTVFLKAANAHYLSILLTESIHYMGQQPLKLSPIL